jgi:D-arabinan exo alpha-(1,3)/(1,5)-arabinofuranosidase (non-reducing end)
MKNNTWIYIVGFLLIVATACSQSTSEITLETLLNEMTDRDNIARFPDPNYSCKQFSSYNQASVSPDHYTWFANLDNNYFLRTEESNGRREFVLFDSEGPGVVVRLWTTYSVYDKKGTIRFYFDNEEEPRIEGEPMKLISGGGLVGYPLSFSVSEETDYSRRGHNLYLPIPFSKRLKITYETNGIFKARDGIDETNDKSEEKFYYQVNYRKYDSDVVLRSFDIEQLKTYEKTIQASLEKIESRDRDLDRYKPDVEEFSGKLVSGENKSIHLDGPGAIRKLQLKLAAENLPQALRSTVISIEFDGKQTICVPVGDFFGAGYQINPASTWYQEVDQDSTMKVFWVMPFQKECKITLTNFGDQDIFIIDGKANKTEWNWDERSMYFGSSWYQNTHLNTGVEKNRDGQGDMFDMKYTMLKGKGVFVGDAVTLFNCSSAWWGEGDEKIFVDGEDFPSHFGTGTEDYYGYAWCRPEKFIHPFIAQPDGSGNLGVGYTLDLRYRTLDAIPFHKSFQFDMEMWHWGSTIINHAPVTYWYMMPGGNCEIEFDAESVKEPVVLRREQIFPAVINENHIIEGEDLIVKKVSGNGKTAIRSLTVPDEPKWTKSFMAWNGFEKGDEITFGFNILETGKYNIALSLLSFQGLDGLSIFINGQEVLLDKSIKSTKQIDTKIDLKKVLLQEGENQMTIKILASPNTDRANMGIDYLKFDKL